MPFQPINFSNIEPQGHPFMRDFVDNLAAGYKAGQLPFAMERQRQKEELANAWQKLLNQEQPEKFSSEMQSAAIKRALDQATTNETNTMTPLKAEELGLKNESYSDLTKAQIQQALALANYYKKGRGRGSNGDDGTNLTKASVTDIQKQTRNIESLLPMLDDIIDFHESGVFGQSPTLFASPDLTAEYESKINPAIDKYIGSFKLPQVESSVNLAKSILTRKKFEGSDAYHARLNKLKLDLLRQKSMLDDQIGSTSSSSSKGFTRVFYKGDSYLIPNDKVMESLSAGGSLNG